jgi:hypothetical protein
MCICISKSPREVGVGGHGVLAGVRSDVGGRGQCGLNQPDDVYLQTTSYD